MAGKKHIEPVTDTLAPVINVSDIMNKYGCSKGKALQIIKHPDLHAYQLGKEFFCERQYWDAFINDLCYSGGTVTMSLATGFGTLHHEEFNPIRDFLADILTQKEWERFISVVYEDNPQ